MKMAKKLQALAEERKISKHLLEMWQKRATPQYVETIIAEQEMIIARAVATIEEALTNHAAAPKQVTLYRARLARLDRDLNWEAHGKQLKEMAALERKIAEYKTKLAELGINMDA